VKGGVKPFKVGGDFAAARRATLCGIGVNERQPRRSIAEQITCFPRAACIDRRYNAMLPIMPTATPFASPSLCTHIYISLMRDAPGFQVEYMSIETNLRSSMALIFHLTREGIRWLR
jgi:hypothetical protein